MFNILLSNFELFLLMLLSFLIFLAIRRFMIRKRKFIFLYHVCLFSILFIVSIGFRSVQNDEYVRLEKFIMLENNNKLEEARNNPQHYDPVFNIDLREFKDSNEFRHYIKEMDATIDRAETIFVAWCFAFLAEIYIVVTQSLKLCLGSIRILH